MIGEYTIRDSVDELLDLYRQLPQEFVEIYELPKLTSEDIIGGIDQLTNGNLDDIKSIIQTSYEQSTGNLIKLELLLKKNRRQWNLSREQSLSIIKYDDTVHSVYSGLSLGQKMALWLIVSHMGRVSTASLTNFIRSGFITDMNPDILAALEGSGLIKISDGVVGLSHDSIFELLKHESDYKKFKLIADQKWLEYYRQKTITHLSSDPGSRDVDQDMLLLQLTFILNIGGTGNVDWMNSILAELSTTIRSSFSYSLIPKLSNIFDEIIETASNQSLIYRTYEWLVIILYKLGHLEEIVSITEKLNPQLSSRLIFLLHSAARVATCDTTVKDDLEAVQKHDNLLYVGSQLLLLRYYRVFNEIRKSRSIWQGLLKLDDKIKGNYKEVIVDQVNLCSFNFKKRNRLLAQSLQGHLNSGNIYHYCSSLLNINANAYYLYFMRLMRKGAFLKLALENLKKVKHFLQYTHYPLHAYQNQKTIYQLVSGKPTLILY